MIYLTRTLRALMLGIMLDPLPILLDIGRRILPGRVGQSQVLELREATGKAPLILQIETINACNAACIFCAYPHMQRPRGVMSMELFTKIVDDYAAMGGGAVSLTPVVGDPLLDPDLLERLQILAAHPEIGQVSLTTNGIALERFSDAEVRLLLQALDCIQISSGGLDEQTYRTLYGVDRFHQVQLAMERLLTLREQVATPAHINLAFRTNDWKFELRHKRKLDKYRRKGVFVSHIWTYANYAGVVSSDADRNLDVFETPGEKSEPCVYPQVHMAVCWDGRVTACGCVDFEGNSLQIGHAGKESLADIWQGTKHQPILETFCKGSLVPICRECTAYQPESSFARPHFKGIEENKPLPLEFFKRFWGG